MNPPGARAQRASSPHGIVLFLGMVRRGEFESLQRRDLRLGVLVDTNSKHRLGDVASFVVVERFDFSRPLADLVACVRGIEQRHGIACLINVIEFYVAQTAAVAAALGLRGIAPSSARLCLDKALMRERFQQCIGPDSAARFHVVDGAADLLATAAKLGYPVFLQPANVSASMWSTRCSTPDALLASYRAIQDEVPAYYERLGQKDKRLVVVVAEYLEGKNTSIDCLVDACGMAHATPVVDVLTGQDVGIDDYHHFARIVPSCLAVPEQAELARLAASGVRALGMTSSAAHVEFIGVRLGEIAARPGGNRPRILDLACGIDLLHAYHEVLQGRIPDLRATQQRAAAIVTPFASRKGTLRSIRHLDRIVELPGYLHHEVRGKPGQPVGLARSGYRAPLYVELLADDLDVVRSSVDEIASWPDLFVTDADPAQG